MVLLDGTSDEIIAFWALRRSIRGFARDIPSFSVKDDLVLAREWLLLWTRSHFFIEWQL